MQEGSERKSLTLYCVVADDRSNKWFRIKLTRVRDLLEDPQQLKSFMAEHCSTSSLRAASTSGSEAISYVLTGYQSLVQANDGTVTACVNPMYLQFEIECDLSSNVFFLQIKVTIVIHLELEASQTRNDKTRIVNGTYSL